MKKYVVTIVALLAVFVLSWGGLKYFKGNTTPAAKFRTAEVSRGDLVVNIAATGTLEPEEVIDVGAQVAGQILQFGTDSVGKPIDYRSVVDEGMVLARIDDSLYQSDVALQTAALEQAKAGVKRAEADLEQLRAKAEQASRDWDRAQKLGPSDALSQASFDAYRAGYDTSRANVTVGAAAVAQAIAQQSSAEASLARSRRNLGYCTIKSPVRGTIIDRRVNIGQTVVSSLNAPSLFLIAKDLSRMQIWVSVNEADIGQIKSGQTVHFNVDALPGQTLLGQVNKVRWNASSTQNVVTYTVEVNVDNPDGKLLPYMTANAQFEVSRHDDVLLVPNAALRYTPDASLLSQNDAQASPGAASEPSTRPASRRSRAGRDDNSTFGTIYVRDGESKLLARRVRLGGTDGTSTEISGSDVTEGMDVVVGEERAEAVGSATANPFQPQFPRGNRTGGGSRSSGGGAGR